MANPTARHYRYESGNSPPQNPTSQGGVDRGTCSGNCQPRRLAAGEWINFNKPGSPRSPGALSTGWIDHLRNLRIPLHWRSPNGPKRQEWEQGSHYLLSVCLKIQPHPLNFSKDRMQPKANLHAGSGSFDMVCDL